MPTRLRRDILRSRRDISMCNKRHTYIQNPCIQSIVRTSTHGCMQNTCMGSPKHLAHSKESFESLVLLQSLRGISQMASKNQRTPAHNTIQHTHKPTGAQRLRIARLSKQPRHKRAAVPHAIQRQWFAVQSNQTLSVFQARGPRA